MGMAGARSLFSCSLARSLTHTRGGRRSPRQPLPNFPNFPAQLFPLLPCARLLLDLPPSSLRQLPSAPQLPRAAARGRLGRDPKGQLHPLCSGLHWPGEEANVGRWTRQVLEPGIAREERNWSGQALPDWLEGRTQRKFPEAGIYNFVSNHCSQCWHVG